MKTIGKLIPIALGLLAIAAVLWILQSPSTSRALALSKTQTTVEDFNQGSFFRTGMTRDADGEVTLLRSGIAGEWISTTNSTGLVPRFGHASIVYNNIIYVFGGRSSSGSLRSIQYSTINTITHDLSNWVTASINLPTSIYTYTGFNPGVAALSAVELNGYVYLLGGENGTQAYRYPVVSFASIGPTGALSALAATAPLPQPLSEGQAVIQNGFIYYIGGRTNLDQGSTKIYYAQPDPATGVITTWYTATANLPYKTYAHMAVAVNDGRLYSMAGVTVTSVSGVVPDVYYAEPLSTTGNIPAWIKTINLPRNIFGGASVSFGGQIYDTGGALDFINNASNLVFAAFAEESGGVFTWTSTSVITPARLQHTAVVNSDGWIYVIGGSDGSNPIRQHMINAGATAGNSNSFYAPTGRFTSNPFDIGKNYHVTGLSWATQLTDPSAVTLTLRYRSRLFNGSFGNWSDLYPSTYAAGIASTTIPLSFTARYIQYAAFFTTTDPLTTPILSMVQLLYETPDPPRVVKEALPLGGQNGVGVVPGDRITYTIQYTNTPNQVLNGAIISDTVPQGTTYVPGSIFASSGITGHPELAPLIFWELGSVPQFATGQVGYVVTVNNTLQEGDFIRNVAGFDSDSVFVLSSVVEHIFGNPMRLIKSHISSAPGQVGNTVQPGDLLTYSLTYSNPATGVIRTGVVITDILPSNITYLSSVGTPAADTSLLVSQGLIRWLIGSVPTNTVGSIGFAARVNSNLAQVPDGSEVDNVAQLGSTGHSLVSSNFGGIDTAPIRYRYDLKLNQSVSAAKANPGDFLTYTIRITNVTSLPITVADIEVNDYLEPGLPGYTETGVLRCVSPCAGWTFVEFDPDGNYIYSLNIPALGPNQSTVVTMVAQISSTITTAAPDVLAVGNYIDAAASAVHGVESDPTNQSEERITTVAGADLEVTNIQVPNKLYINTAYNYQVTIGNAGLINTLGPDGTRWFGVDLYLKPVGSLPPFGPADRYLGFCAVGGNYPFCTQQNSHYATVNYTTTPGVGGVLPGGTAVVTYTLTFMTPGTYWLYAQADPYWAGPLGPSISATVVTSGTASHGRIIEGNEVNNIFGPVAIVVQNFKIYLPIIRKS